jgi:hypothetical protein
MLIISKAKIYRLDYAATVVVRISALELSKA